MSSEFGFFVGGFALGLIVMRFMAAAAIRSAHARAISALMGDRQ